MADLIVRPAASDDIAAIYAYSVENFGPDTAERYHDGLKAALARLSDFPETGPIYPNLRPPIRFLTHQRHHIFYDFDGTTVSIVRILHHAMDVRRVL